MHGGGRGYEELSEGGSGFVDVSSVRVVSTERGSWKLAPRLLHRGDGLSSWGSPP